jgi:hypothetical protein
MLCCNSYISKDFNTSNHHFTSCSLSVSDQISKPNSHHNDGGKFSHIVQYHVSLQTDLPSLCLPTDQTHKSLFTTLYHKTSHKLLSVSDRLLTCCTCVRFVTNVNARMRVKYTLSDQTFVRHFTLVGMIIGMYPRTFSSKAPVLVKCTPNVWHGHGFSAVCVLTLISEFGHIIKTFPHTDHMCTYSVCNFVCRFKSRFHLKVLPFRQQPYSCFTVCKVLCFKRLPF